MFPCPGLRTCLDITRDLIMNCPKHMIINRGQFEYRFKILGYRGMASTLHSIDRDLYCWTIKPFWFNRDISYLDDIN